MAHPDNPPPSPRLPLLPSDALSSAVPFSRTHSASVDGSAPASSPSPSTTSTFDDAALSDVSSLDATELEHYGYEVVNRDDTDSDVDDRLPGTHTANASADSSEWPEGADTAPVRSQGRHSPSPGPLPSRSSDPDIGAHGLHSDNHNTDSDELGDSWSKSFDASDDLSDHPRSRRPSSPTMAIRQLVQSGSPPTSVKRTGRSDSSWRARPYSTRPVKVRSGIQPHRRCPPSNHSQTSGTTLDFFGEHTKSERHSSRTGGDRSGSISSRTSSASGDDQSKLDSLPEIGYESYFAFPDPLASTYSESEVDNSKQDTIRVRPSEKTAHATVADSLTDSRSGVESSANTIRAAGSDDATPLGSRCGLPSHLSSCKQSNPVAGKSKATSTIGGEEASEGTSHLTVSVDRRTAALFGKDSKVDRAASRVHAHTNLPASLRIIHLGSMPFPSLKDKVTSMLITLVLGQKGLERAVDADEVLAREYCTSCSPDESNKVKDWRACDLYSDARLERHGFGAGAANAGSRHNSEGQSDNGLGGRLLGLVQPFTLLGGKEHKGSKESTTPSLTLHALDATIPLSAPGAAQLGECVRSKLLSPRTLLESLVPRLDTREYGVLAICWMEKNEWADALENQLHAMLHSIHGLEAGRGHMIDLRLLPIVLPALPNNLDGGEPSPNSSQSFAAGNADNAAETGSSLRRLVLSGSPSPTLSSLSSPLPSDAEDISLSSFDTSSDSRSDQREVEALELALELQMAAREWRRVKDSCAFVHPGNLVEIVPVPGRVWAVGHFCAMRDEEVAAVAGIVKGLVNVGEVLPKPGTSLRNADDDNETEAKAKAPSRQLSSSTALSAAAKVSSWAAGLHTVGTNLVDPSHPPSDAGHLAGSEMIQSKFSAVSGTSARRGSSSSSSKKNRFTSGFVDREPLTLWTATSIVAAFGAAALIIALIGGMFKDPAATDVGTSQMFGLHPAWPKGDSASEDKPSTAFGQAISRFCAKSTMDRRPNICELTKDKSNEMDGASGTFNFAWPPADTAGKARSGDDVTSSESTPVAVIIKPKDEVSLSDSRSSDRQGDDSLQEAVEPSTSRTVSEGPNTTQIFDDGRKYVDLYISPIVKAAAVAVNTTFSSAKDAAVQLYEQAQLMWRNILWPLLSSTTSALATSARVLSALLLSTTASARKGAEHVKEQAEWSSRNARRGAGRAVQMGWECRSRAKVVMQDIYDGQWGSEGKKAWRQTFGTEKTSPTGADHTVPGFKTTFDDLWNRIVLEEGGEEGVTGKGKRDDSPTLLSRSWMDEPILVNRNSVAKWRRPWCAKCAAETAKHEAEVKAKAEADGEGPEWFTELLRSGVLF